MAVIWTVPEQTPSRKKMRRAELATVFNSECLKALYYALEWWSIQKFAFCFLSLNFFAANIGMHAHDPDLDRP